jgi:hypothetical protein
LNSSLHAKLQTVGSAAGTAKDVDSLPPGGNMKLPKTTQQMVKRITVRFDVVKRGVVLIWPPAGCGI